MAARACKAARSIAAKAGSRIWQTRAGQQLILVCWEKAPVAIEQSFKGAASV
jgi:hypothetical protein